MFFGLKSLKSFCRFNSFPGGKTGRSFRLCIAAILTPYPTFTSSCTRNGESVHTAGTGFERIARTKNIAPFLIVRHIVWRGGERRTNPDQRGKGTNVALVKRGKTWHCHFVVNGQRFRQSLKTSDWREAQSKEKDLIGQAIEGKLTQTSTSLARQPFGQAADDYVTARKLELAQPSRSKEKQLLVQLRAYFKQEPLRTITAKRIIEYRAWRAEQKVGPATLNAELGILRRIMKRARTWARVADDIRPLREPSSIGKALTEEEKQRLLKMAVMRSEWETAYLAAVLCLNTTAQGCELKGLQWSDVDLFAKTLTIRKSKTAAGERIVPSPAWPYRL